MKPKTATPDTMSAADGLMPAAFIGHGDAGTDVLVDGYAFGSLSMTAYTLGLSGIESAGQGGSPPPAADGPSDASNI